MSANDNDNSLYEDSEEHSDSDQLVTEGQLLNFDEEIPIDLPDNNAVLKVAERPTRSNTDLSKYGDKDWEKIQKVAAEKAKIDSTVVEPRSKDGPPNPIVTPVSQNPAVASTSTVAPAATSTKTLPTVRLPTVHTAAAVTDKQGSTETNTASVNIPAAVNTSKVPKMVTVDDLAAMLAKVTKIKNEEPRTLHIKDLPTFSGQGHEDAENFLLKFERIGKVYSWKDTDYVRHMFLALEKNALKWHDANKALTDWADLKKAFLQTFGKSRIDIDLQGPSKLMRATTDPLGYVFDILEQLRATNPSANDTAKVDALFVNLPSNLKSSFIRDPPKTTQEFTERLRDVVREFQYNEKALMENTSSSLLATLSGPIPTSRSAFSFTEAPYYKQSYKEPYYTSRYEPRYESRYEPRYETRYEPLYASYASIPQPEPVRETERELRLENKVRRLSNQVARMETSRPPLRSTTYSPTSTFPSARLNSRTTDGRPICHACGKPGHLIRDCRTKQRPPPPQQQQNFRQRNVAFSRPAVNTGPVLNTRPAFVSFADGDLNDLRPVVNGRIG